MKKSIPLLVFGVIDPISRKLRRIHTLPSKVDSPIQAHRPSIVLSRREFQESKLGSGGIGGGEMHLPPSTSKRSPVITVVVTYMTTRLPCVTIFPTTSIQRPSQRRGVGGHRNHRVANIDLEGFEECECNKGCLVENGVCRNPLNGSCSALKPFKAHCTNSSKSRP